MVGFQVRALSRCGAGRSVSVPRAPRPLAAPPLHWRRSAGAPPPSSALGLQLRGAPRFALFEGQEATLLLDAFSAVAVVAAELAVLHTGLQRLIAESKTRMDALTKLSETVTADNKTMADALTKLTDALTSSNKALIDTQAQNNSSLCGLLVDSRAGVERVANSLAEAGNAHSDGLERLGVEVPEHRSRLDALSAASEGRVVQR